MPNCPEVIALLVDYLEDRLPAATRQELEQHLAGCPTCEADLASYRSTVNLLHSLSEEDLPPALHLRLKAFLEKHGRN